MNWVRNRLPNSTTNQPNKQRRKQPSNQQLATKQLITISHPTRASNKPRQLVAKFCEHPGLNDCIEQHEQLILFTFLLWAPLQRYAHARCLIRLSSAPDLEHCYQAWGSFVPRSAVLINKRISHHALLLETGGLIVSGKFLLFMTTLNSSWVQHILTNHRIRNNKIWNEMTSVSTRRDRSRLVKPMGGSEPPRNPWPPAQLTQAHCTDRHGWHSTVTSNFQSLTANHGRFIPRPSCFLSRSWVAFERTLPLSPVALQCASAGPTSTWCCRETTWRNFRFAWGSIFHTTRSGW